MSDKFLIIIITDLAKLRIRIDSMANRHSRDELEKEFAAKRLDLLKTIPNRHQDLIDDFIDAEIRRITGG